MEMALAYSAAVKCRPAKRNPMLLSLRIKNLALVEDLTLELQPGYNVITGETGAGKSILIGGLTLVLGERADRSLIRSGADSCSVEALFDVTRLDPALHQFLDGHGLEPCDEGQLLIKRTFTSGGANRQFVNHSPTTLAVLASLGEWLVDIHGPHEHQSLLHRPQQLAILDAYGELANERKAFAELVARRALVEGRKSALIIDEKTYAQQLDLLRYQVNEITAARLNKEAEATLEQDFQRASNAARLLQLSQAALEVLDESETSIRSQVLGLGRTLQELGRIDGSAAPLLTLHEQGVSLLQELQVALSRYAEQIEVDPGRLQCMEERLNVLQTLKRKYGPSLAEVLAFGEEAGRKLEALEGRDAELERIDSELKQVEAELWRAGKQLSAHRRKVAPQLGKAVGKELSELGFAQSRFEVDLSTLSDPLGFNASGLDGVEFQFAPNAGEPARPLRAIASSGELARVMLALKTVLAAEDQIPVLVFDEVDANVGGETARAVGLKLQEIARNRQVLCITHLPQVAASASAHYVVSKHNRAGRTLSEISRLEGPSRVTELARMLGGQTEAARKHAQALVAESQ